MLALQPYKQVSRSTSSMMTRTSSGWTATKRSSRSQFVRTAKTQPQGHFSDSETDSRHDSDSENYEDDDDDEEEEEEDSVSQEDEATTLPPWMSRRRKKSGTTILVDVTGEGDEGGEVMVVDQQAYSVPYRRADHNEIMRELNETILFQELAMEQIGVLLQTVCNSPLHTNGKGTDLPLRERIHKRILSGPSGVGKSESVRLVQRMLGMAPGEPFAAQFIYIDGSEYQDATQMNRLVGAGPGYALCDSRITLVDDLQRAANTDKQAVEIVRPAPPPPYILLFIDEIDKTHVSFMSVINGLLEEGQIRSSRGEMFVLPAHTHLIVLFTSNYGHTEIARTMLRVQDQQRAVRHVEQDMRAQGLAPNSIERFGSHVIFYPIAGENLRAVVRRKIGDFVQRPSQLTTRYGPIEYSGAVECITDLVLATSDPERGIRNAIKQLGDCLSPLLLTAFLKLGQQQQQQRENHALRLLKMTLPLAALTCVDRLLQQPDERALVDVIRADVTNRKKIEVYQEDGGAENVHVICVADGTSIITGVVVPLVVAAAKCDAVTVEDGDDDDKQSYEMLLRAVREAIRCDNVEGLRQCLTTLTGEKRRLLSAPEEEPATKKVRREPVTRRCDGCATDKPFVAFERLTAQGEGKSILVRGKLCVSCYVASKKQQNK